MNPSVSLKAFAASSGMFMVAATLPDAPVIAMAAAAPAAMLVVVSLWFRTAAAAAVLAAIATLALGYPTALLASLAGLGATAYLLMTYAAEAPSGELTTTRQTLTGAAVFALVGLAAVAFPLELPWLPVVAPVAVVLLFALAILPYTQPASGRRQDHVGERR